MSEPCDNPVCVVLQDNREKKLRVFDPRANSSSGVSPYTMYLHSKSHCSKSPACVHIYRRSKFTVDRKTLVFFG